MSNITTFEGLFEFMAQKIEEAQGNMLEQKRATLIADAVYEAAAFVLQVTPTNDSHRLFLASEMLKRLRRFHSPFFVVSREMGEPDTLRQLFEQFLKSTHDWPTSQH